MKHFTQVEDFDVLTWKIFFSWSQYQTILLASIRKCDINISKQMSDCLFKLSNCFQLFCRFTNKNYWQYAWADREVWIFPIILRAGHWKGLFLDLKLAQVLGFYVCIYSHLKRRQIHPSWVAIWLYILNSYFIYTGNDFLRFSDGIKLWYNKTS
jgi:hypothetical protein